MRKKLRFRFALLSFALLNKAQTKQTKQSLDPCEYRHVLGDK